jgi:hypothetical protein
MEVSALDLARVPAENLRTPRAEFARLWLVAEGRAESDPDWYAFGVAATCRWMAGATVRPDQGPWYPAPAPVTQRTGRATPELIQRECVEAEVLAMRQPEPVWLARRPGWIDGTIATLNWAWLGTGRVPLDIDRRVS